MHALIEEAVAYTLHFSSIVLHPVTFFVTVLRRNKMDTYTSSMFIPFM